jgi:HEPN domain-containing protein
MKPLAAEWVAKAEGDFLTAGRELAAADRPNYDGVCFHAQQCAEKYLKALLVEEGVAFPKVHDLAALLSLLLPFHPEWEAHRRSCEALTDSAVEVRYPGFSAAKDDARAALDTATELRRAARRALELGE